MRLRTQLLTILLVLALVIGAGSLCRHVIGPRVVARTVTPEGVEMCIVQQSEWSDLPWFTTRFAYRKNGVWKLFYYQHEDDYWAGSRASLNTNAHTAIFYRGKAPTITFNWETETYTAHRRPGSDFSPQTMPAGWSPTMRR